jgi:predicted metal-dependent peptidase
MTGLGRLNATRVAAARLWAAHRFPYLAAAVFASAVRARDGIGTVAVDERWRLYLDPAVVERWSAEELGSVLVHHACHLLRDHAERGRALGVAAADGPAWVTAADAEINDDLHSGGLRLPGDPVLPSSFGCEEGLLAEQYYEVLRRHRDGGGRCERDCGSGSDGRPREWDEGGEDGGRDASPGLSPYSARLLRCQVAAEILCHGREAGTVPAGLLRWAEAVLRPTVDWRRALAAEIRHGVSDVSGCVDYSYRRPSRRAQLSAPVVLPALRRPVPRVAVVCDTSGSMSDDLLGRVLAEVEGILRGVGVRAEGMRVLSCDALVHSVRRVSSARQVQLLGGGGTNMGVGIEEAVRTRPRPQVVVVLTDGYTPWPPSPPPGVRVVVGIVGGGGHPPPGWARVVRVDDE